MCAYVCCGCVWSASLLDTAQIIAKGVEVVPCTEAAETSKHVIAVAIDLVAGKAQWFFNGRSIGVCNIRTYPSWTCVCICACACYACVCVVPVYAYLQ